MFRKCFVSMAAAVAALLFVPVCQAAYRAPMAIDRSFGQDGFAAVPPYQPGFGVFSAVGFVTLDSGDYLLFTTQTLGSSTILAATRFNAEGSIVTNWGLNGSNIYPIPFDYSQQIRITKRVALGGQEYVYLVGVGGPSATSSYAVEVVRVSDGAQYSFSQSGPFGFPAVPLLHARHASAISDSGDVAIVGHGYNNAGGPGEVTDLFHTTSDPPVIDVTFSAWTELNLPALEIFEMTSGAGGLTLAGRTSSQAMILFYDPAARSTLATNAFNLPCPSAAVPLFSSVDHAVPITGQDFLVYGRSLCSGDPNDHVALMRMSGLHFSTPTPVWVLPFEEANSGCALLTACSRSYFDILRVYLANSHTATYYALATTTNGALEHVDLGMDFQTPKLAGTEINNADFSIAPSQILGSDLQADKGTLVAVSNRLGQLGLARIDIDRIFADMDVTP